MKNQRTYKIRLYPNRDKLDTSRYTNCRFIEYTNMFMGKYYFMPKIRISTAGLGLLANEARNKSRGIVSAILASGKETGKKTNVPYVIKIGCPALISKSQNSSFDYWVRVSNQWKLKGGVYIPAKSHKALNRALKDGWKMSVNCEFKIINGNSYALVFVSKETPKIRKPKSFIGVDVGMKHSIVTSEGHLGHGLSTVVRRQKHKSAERQRQKHRISDRGRTEVKQLLDREAKIVMRRSQKIGAGIAVEDPKRLANLRAGSLHGWARSYFANRLHVLGKENGVLVVDVNPYQTSITCSSCGNVNKQSRVSRDAFVCKGCGYSAHADVNAAVTISQKGSRLSERVISEYRGERNQAAPSEV